MKTILAAVSFGLAIPAAADAPARVDVSTLTGKVMCGYQGWFNTPDDGAGLGWTHWARDRKKRFAPGNVTVDLWPDVSEYTPDELHETGFRHADGRHAKVFSSHNRDTVMRHFQWMREYGIDGAFVQRFANGLHRDDLRRHKDAVLAHARAGANAHGRAFAVMYDLSGLPKGGTRRVIDDWKRLRGELSVAKDPACLHHNGRPVVAVWGVGFHDANKPREYTLAECLELVRFLKADGCTVMLGVPTGWRDLDRDAVRDPQLHALLTEADILSPWTVGRYRDPAGAKRHAARYWKPDLAWCRERDLDYLPVVFPGFSWHNLKGEKLDAIPRRKGEFLWSQFLAAKAAGAQMIYVAMFDEVDEGTAIFKCTTDPPVGDGVAFLTYEGLPSDFYLRLTGHGARLICGEIPPDPKVPGAPPFLSPLKTSHTFHIDDQNLQQLHTAAERKLRDNLVHFTPSTQVLVEGGGYPNAWIETQPMGGEMFASRDVQTALNNSVIFMLTQRDDGRLPGMVIAGDVARKNGWVENPPEAHLWFPEAGLLADYEMFQGFCFPEPAWRMYHWIGKDRRFLELLRDALAGHDAYLWRTRDSNRDGILETWCVWDTGEDDAKRLTTRWAPNRWPFDQPPGTPGMPDPRDPAALRQYWHRGDGPATLDAVRVPFQSMDVMAYSYNARATLAKIEAELGNNAKAAEWHALANQVRQTLIAKLWVPERHACFDLDRDGNRLPELIHNNLRCMWYGIFTQEMADAFVDHHLLNPESFWTPIPLVSVAIHEPLFHNGLRNNWSGQPQGLTYQRAIDALERYGRFTEVTRLGQKLLPALIRKDYKFTQQLDPITGAPSGQKDDGYGPMMLATLGYFSRLHGIHLDVDNAQVWWSAIDDTPFTTTQQWGDHHFKLESNNGIATLTTGGKSSLTFTTGTRVVTDLKGKPLQIIGIHPEPQTVTLTVGTQSRKVTVRPNQVITLAHKEKTP